MESLSPKMRRFNIFYFVLAFWALIFLYDFVNYKRSTEAISYSQFLNFIDEGRIAELTLSATQIQGIFKEAQNGKHLYFTTIRVEDPSLTTRLQEKKIKFQGTLQSDLWKSILSWVLPLFFMFLLWRFLFQRFSQSAGGSFLSVGKAKVKVYVEKDIKVTFNDVAGVDEAKEELREVVDFLKEPQKYSVLGGRIPKGILLIGPPGCGKTLLAKAVAGEAKVPFFSINGSEFVEMFVGVGAARVRDLFDQARKQAPCIIFIDELDALGRSRILGSQNLSGNDEKEQTLNQLLAELDGFDTSQGVILLAATNRPEILDPALLRSGRFDRQVLVDKPDKAGRVQILKVHVQKIKLDASVDLETIAGLSAGFSGADLANLANEAAVTATRRQAKAVFQEDFTIAIERIIAGLEHKKRVMNPEEKRRIAFHEMGHATIGLALNQAEKIHKVSIIPRGIGSLGYTISRPLEDRYVMDRAELIHKIAVLLGGRAAEILYFKNISTGIHDDLTRASDLARAMVTQYGMSQNLGLMTFRKESSPFLKGMSDFSADSYSEKTAQMIDEESNKIMQEAYALAADALNQHKSFIEKGVEALLKQETLSEEEISQLWKQCS